jgi:hypothetical protein
MKPICSVALTLISLSFLASPAGAAQSKSTSADRLGLTCTQILQMTSDGWVKKFVSVKDATAPSTIQAISVYGKCYDARTNRLATALGKSGKGPLMGARGNFGDYRPKPRRDFLYSGEGRRRKSSRGECAALDSHSAFHLALYLPRRRVEVP